MQAEQIALLTKEEAAPRRRSTKEAAPMRSRQADLSCNYNNFYIYKYVYPW